MIGIIVVVVVVVAVGAYFAVTYHPTKKVVKPTVTVVSNQTITLAPPNPNELVIYQLLVLQIA